jgi:uncharacterized protein (TIGR02147 family)
MSIDIYAYDDFRIYLRDCFNERQKQDPDFTYRTFAAEAGFSNPGFLNDVVKGRRKLSKDAEAKMIAGFHLSDNEAVYFKLLVSYGQAKDDEERSELFKQILSRRNRSKFSRINPSLAKYYQDYRYPLVRCAIKACDFRGDYEMLASFLDPPLPLPELKKTVRELCDWGLVTQDAEGHYTVSSNLVEPPETLMHLIPEMNGEWIKHAYSALRRLPATKRHISSILCSISDESYQRIQERIVEFREWVFAQIEQDTNPERVVQLNFQLFPRSRTCGAKNGKNQENKRDS